MAEPMFIIVGTESDGFERRYLYHGSRASNVADGICELENLMNKQSNLGMKIRFLNTIRWIKEDDGSIMVNDRDLLVIDPMYCVIGEMENDNGEVKFVNHPFFLSKIALECTKNNDYYQHIEKYLLTVNTDRAKHILNCIISIMTSLLGEC